MHTKAAEKLVKEAEIRKQKYEKQSRVKPSTIETGQRVLVRDRTIRGRNKIQDRWSTKVHKVVEQLENGTYEVEPADGYGSTRVVNRTELQVCPPSVLQKTPAKARRRRVPVAPRYPSSSDNNSHPGVAIEFPFPLMSSLMMQLTFLIVILTRVLQISMKLMMNCLLDVLPDQQRDIIVTDSGCPSVCPETLGSVVFSV